LFVKKERKLFLFLKKRNRKLKTGHFSLFEKRETEKLTTLHSFVKKSLKLFLFLKETKTNDTLNFNFSLQNRDRKLTTFATYFPFL
ncbi:MAG: hypothetical protein LBC07_00340, partial [Elusimicrobiota bacterium]|nr:hypothetical protein [Elusimicrobiota bacterium]